MLRAIGWLAGFIVAAILSFTLGLIFKGVWKFIRFIFGRA